VDRVCSRPSRSASCLLRALVVAGGGGTTVARYFTTMTESPRLTYTSTVLDAPDARELAAFYQRLLGWEIEQEEDDWVVIRSADDSGRLAFQTESAYVRPVWPAKPGDQQMQMHLDIKVDDLEAAGAHAVAVGAVLADFQPQDDVRVFLDPVGHPFCLYL